MNCCLLRRIMAVVFCNLLLVNAFSQTKGGEKSRNEGASKSTAASASVSPVDYVLQPQDIIRVQVFQEEEINKQGEVSISSESTITLPMIGTVSVAGLTVRQAEQKIRDLYDKDYIVNPGVSVNVLKYSDRSVNVVGSIKNAGRVQFPPEKGLTILEAISLAGGHDRLADLKRVKLTRKNETVVVNVDDIVKGGAKDVALEVGDVVFVPERIL
jgi:polysaccharide export outer membrane protein